ncbi:MAG: hypothetical protein KW802_04065 [Candidatus Doudnabacteria bacterium]|nr:hypothetical protein [Candidatus Doudnabacteria bacterium]
MSEVPFRNLETTGSHGKYSELKSLPEDPDLLVKEMRSSWEGHPKPGIHPLVDVDRAKQTLDFLQQNFPEYAVPASLVVGRNEKDEKTIYTVVHRIEGKSLPNLEPTPELKAQLRKFLSEVVDAYFKNLFYNGDDPKAELESYCPDLNQDNFFLGRDAKLNETENRLYYIDSYPMARRTPDSLLNKYFPQLKGNFGEAWHPILEDFIQEARHRIEEHVAQNSGQFPRLPKTQWYTREPK